MRSDEYKKVVAYIDEMLDVILEHNEGEAMEEGAHGDPGMHMGNVALIRVAKKALEELL